MRGKRQGVRADIGVPEGSPEVEVEGVRIAYAREGGGPPVVCLHATGHGGGDYAAFAAAARDRFEVIRIDWPGQGRSGEDSVPASAARYAELLGPLLEKLRVERPIIIGNSIGGAAALIHANRHPVRALVLCNSGGLVKVGFVVRRFCGVFARFFAGGMRRAWWYRPAFYFYYRFMVLPKRAAAAQRKRIIRAGVELAPLLHASWNSFRRPDADIRGIATALDIPVWFAWGRKDRVIPLKLCLPCIKQMKQARITTFDAGHAAFLEQPEAFVQGFLAFEEELAAPGNLATLRTA